MSEREKLIEKMARALAASHRLLWADLSESARAVWRKHAQATLSAIEAEAVIVPREATAEMLDAMFVQPDVGCGGHIIRHSIDKLPGAFTAMIAASPYRRT